MNHEGEIDRYVDDPCLLVALCRDVFDRLGVKASSESMAEGAAQLREIALAIDKLDKQDVPVPAALRSEKIRLAAELDHNSKRLAALKMLADELHNITHNLKSRHIKSTERAQIGEHRRKRSNTLKTSRPVLRILIIEALNELGGSAHKRDVYKRIAKNHEGRFLPGDFDYLPDGKRISWQNYCDWEATLMRKEELLRSDSPRGIWENQ
jgi:hypothetical protein